MASHAVVKNDIVENVIEIDNSNPLFGFLSAQGYKLIDLTNNEKNVGIGWNHSEEEGFHLVTTEPVVEESTEQE